jgi:hypothetical protein
MGYNKCVVILFVRHQCERVLNFRAVKKPQQWYDDDISELTDKLECHIGNTSYTIAHIGIILPSIITLSCLTL